jgi:hypothetical protein
VRVLPREGSFKRALHITPPPARDRRPRAHSGRSLLPRSCLCLRRAPVPTVSPARTPPATSRLLAIPDSAGASMVSFWLVTASPPRSTRVAKVLCRFGARPVRHWPGGARPDERRRVARSAIAAALQTEIVTPTVVRVGIAMQPSHVAAISS